MIESIFQLVFANLFPILGVSAVIFFILFCRTMRGSGRKRSIMLACQWGDLKEVKSLVVEVPWLVQQADSNGFTPLHVAAMWGHAQIVARLLKAGADVNAKNKAGMTPLHGAAMADHAEVVHILLLHKADAKARDGMGNTPLYFAVWDGHKQVVELLLTHGADPGAENAKGETPLQRAEAHGHSEVLSLLTES